MLLSLPLLGILGWTYCTPFINYVCPFHGKRLKLTSYRCVWHSLIFGDPERLQNILCFFPPFYKLRELACFCLLFSSRSEASQNRSNLQIHFSHYFSLAKSKCSGGRNAAPEAIPIQIFHAWLLLKSTNTKLVTVVPLSFVCSCSTPIP